MPKHNDCVVVVRGEFTGMVGTWDRVWDFSFGWVTNDDGWALPVSPRHVRKSEAGHFTPDHVKARLVTGPLDEQERRATARAVERNAKKVRAKLRSARNAS